MSKNRVQQNQVRCGRADIILSKASEARGGARGRFAWRSEVGRDSGSRFLSGFPDMSRYFIAIEDAESVWPPVGFDDGDAAVLHAIKVAKSLEGVRGAPRLVLRYPNGDSESWSAEGLLTVARKIGAW